MSYWPIRSEIRPAFNGGLLQGQFIIGGVHVVWTKAQRNNINLLRRKLDLTTTTLAIVLEENRIYKLVNNPASNTTTDLDWQIFFIGETSAFRPIGTWDADNDNPVLSDAGALDLNGQFYFVTDAPTQRTVQYPGLFLGLAETVIDGDLVVSVGDRWIVITSSLSWDAFQKPSVINDYVAGIVIPHTHLIEDVQDLQTTLDQKYELSDTADHEIDFNNVPDIAIVEVEFLRQHYYTAAEINALLEQEGPLNFLTLPDTPNTYTGNEGDVVRVKEDGTGLEFVIEGFWKPGTYTSTNVVVYSVHSGSAQLYELIDPSRPFISQNIATEELEGKWAAILNKPVLDEVSIDPDGQTIVLNMKNEAQKWFKLIDNIEQDAYWQFTNDTSLLEFKIRFFVTDFIYFHFPVHVRMSDALFYPDNTREFIDLGEYEMIGTFDGNSYLIKIFGPLQGAGNLMPTVFDNVITQDGNYLDGPYTYFDAESDPENNPLPEAQNVVMNGTGEVGQPLTIDYDFHSPSGYTEGTPIIVWYTSNEDGTNEQVIDGVTGLTHTPLDTDDGKLMYADVSATQTAPAPANGNPTGLPVRTNSILVQIPVTGVEELELDDFYDNVMKAENYDAVNFRIPDTGLINNGATFWTSPLAENRPTYDSVNKRLRFDPSTTVRYIDAAIPPSNSKGSAGTRRYEFVGVFEVNTLPAGESQIFAVLTSLLFKIETGNEFFFQSSSGNDFDGFTVQAGQKYRFRLRTDINATSGFWEAQLQLNYDEDQQTYLLNQTIQGTNGGAGISAGNTQRLGASKNVPPTRGFDGWWYEFAQLGQAHLPAENEAQLWRRLNSVAGIN